MACQCKGDNIKNSPDNDHQTTCISQLIAFRFINFWNIKVSFWILALQWCHNERDGVSNHLRIDYLFNRLFRSRSKKTSSSASLVFVGGIHRWPVDSPHKGPVTRKMFPFDDIIIGIISNIGQEQAGSHIDHIFKWIFQNKKYGFWFLGTNCRYFDKTKLSSLSVPEYVGFFFQMVLQPTTKIMFHISKIVYPNIKSGYPMLKVALTCLNYIVPE